ncbi:MAG TPA: amidohydrolase [Candidatus Dormibacteraeota bacterium]
MSTEADLILRGGSIYPLGRYGLRPVSHLAMRASRVVAAGGAEVMGLRTPSTRLLDLAGGAALPGFDDAHAHVVYNGLSSFWADLTGTPTIPRLLERMRRHAAKLPAGEWALGRGYSTLALQEGRPPTRSELDSVTGSRPCFIDERGGHSRVGNSAALAAAGVTESTPDPPGGAIGRADDGSLDGRLLETAMRLVADVQPPPTLARRQQGILRSQRLLLSRGVTSAGAAVNRGFADDLFSYQQLAQAKRLRMRINAFVSWELLGDAAGLGLARAFGGEQVVVGPIKVFVDGGAGPGNAALRAGGGTWRTPPDELRRIVTEAQAAGLQVAAHAIGDAAIAAMCDAVDRAGPAARARRHRVEHCTVCPADLRSRLSALGMVAVMQPLFLSLGRQRAESFFGPEGAKAVAAHRAILAAGVPIAFSSDLPVVPDPNPWPGLRLAVEDDLHPLTPLQALTAYTAGGAWAANQEGFRGTLEPGRAADLQVYTRDPIKEGPAAWNERLRPSAVLVGGALVFRSRR